MRFQNDADAQKVVSNTSLEIAGRRIFAEPAREDLSGASKSQQSFSSDVSPGEQIFSSSRNSFAPRWGSAFSRNSASKPGNAEYQDINNLDS